MIRSIPAHWQGAILVCGKCSRRAGGGFGAKGRTSLAKLLRRAGLAGKGRKAARGVVETGCLKICPKDAVVAIDSRTPGRWLVVSVGTGAEALAAEFGDPAAPSADDQGPLQAGTS